LIVARVEDLQLVQAVVQRERLLHEGREVMLAWVPRVGREGQQIIGVDWFRLQGSWGLAVDFQGIAVGIERIGRRDATVEHSPRGDWGLRVPSLKRRRHVLVL
jgi:hypothetical protein